MDRAGLFTAVLEDTNREDKADRLPEWLASAEFRINLALRDERMIKRAVLEITETTFPVPPDFIAPKGNLSIRKHLSDPIRPGEVVGALAYFPSDQIDNGLANPSSAFPRPPRWFTKRGRNIELGGWNSPGPFQIDMWYYAELPKLTADDSTNWLMEKAPHVYKDAMLHFAFLHLQEFDTADRCLMRMTAEIQFMNDKAEENKHGDGPLIMRPRQGFGSRRVQGRR